MNVNHLRQADYGEGAITLMSNTFTERKLDTYYSSSSLDVTQTEKMDKFILHNNPQHSLL